MPRLPVLLEIQDEQEHAFEAYFSLLESPASAVASAESAFDTVAGLGVELVTDLPPVPLLADDVAARANLAAFSATDVSPDITASSIVVAAEVDSSRMPELTERPGVQVWDNSPLTLLDPCQGCRESADADDVEDWDSFDEARSAAGIDCRPFRTGVQIRTIRTLLGVYRAWRNGFRGQNIVVGIIDEGVNDDVYPVVGGFSRPNAQLPGTAPVTSHGSMCAADVLVAAPAAKLYDYPFLGIQNSGGALQMFQAALSQRRLDGTPQVLNNSYGFVGVPPQEQAPNHEIWNLAHPLHRKVREVVASQAVVLFAAGNCGSECPSGACHSSGIGPGQSIHASNSLAEVLTIAAVNSRHQRIGYSSQGPGMFEANKPDLAAYSHFFGNFGPGRPGGESQPFDNGTSAATPVAAGVVALLLSAFPDRDPDAIRDALVSTAVNIGPPGYDHLTGHGVINAAAAFSYLLNATLRS